MEIILCKVVRLLQWLQGSLSLSLSLSLSFTGAHTHTHIVPGIFYVDETNMLVWRDSMKALRRERAMLSKLMQKRFSEEERKRLFHRWGIALDSKRRRLQLANQLWSNTNDMNHIIESAAIVAKLIRFVEQGRALKEMFGLSFTPSNARRRSFSWKNSKASLL